MEGNIPKMNETTSTLDRFKTPVITDLFLFIL